MSAGSPGDSGAGSPAAAETPSRPPPAAPPATPAAEARAHAAPAKPTRTAALALAALGVVFGDIGTSPLYAIKECVTGEHGVAPSAANVLGVLSLVFWSLTMVVAVKYLACIMRAHNRGEGGILAMLALVPARLRASATPRIGWLAALVVFGAALLYGDGVITPAISVLSAVEGLRVAAPSMSPDVVVLVSLVVLFGLFAIQSRGTSRVGAVFGPVMVVWFATLGVLGAVHVARAPAVLAALSPGHAVRFFAEHRGHGFLVLGAVVLAFTGAEAVYADMGHFGARAIRVGWFGLAMPALLLNYFGQGALLLREPGAATNPFYALVPTGGWTYALTALATVATIIASQALISGVYSLTHQAVQLGFFPRVTVVHTSGETEGQIYVPEINWGLMLACTLLVAWFRESSRLAAAYGIAVTGTMTITSVVYFVVLVQTWRWPLWRAVLLVGLFLSFDLAYFGANLLKIVDGGWVPIALGTGVYVVMTTWKKGRGLLAQQVAARTLKLEAFLEDVERTKPHRVRGTAVFMTSNPEGVPLVLLHHFKHNQVLHEVIVLFSVMSENVPKVPRHERVDVRNPGHGFYQIVARYGFMQTPNVPRALREAASHFAVPCDPGRTSYFLGRETLLTTGRSKMMRWRKALFAFTSRNARTATAYFGIPPDRVVEMGMQIDL